MVRYKLLVRRFNIAEISDKNRLDLRKLIGLFAIGLISVSCTSTSSGLNDTSASSSHNSIKPQQQYEVAQNSPATQPVKQTLPGVENSDARSYASAQQSVGAENQPPTLAANGNLTPNSDVNRSGVVYQKPVAAAAIPPSTAPQVASLSDSSMPAGSDAMAYADPNSPENLAQQRIDQLYPNMPHASCKGGWATPPDRLDAKRVTGGHPYYMEMRLRNTPLLPVGHTYIAYGRLGEDGTLLNEHVVMLSPIGGYGGAAIAAALPIPGILKPVADDCRIKPHAAYRVSLNAEQFEKLLLRIKMAQKKIPAYALFAYNCNHFASDIAASVGILPPKNIYLPAVKYIYGVIEANEGYNPKKVRRG